ncbi:MurR/RpiR family transcriptional regulator [bacterium]|nr:MAG: MurR/RpiR family transcriptional regulator [bacterium]
MSTTSIEHIEARIADHYKSLTRNQRKVADYILNNMNEVAFLSVIELGGKCGASKATVVRLTQRLGYDGYVEFKAELQDAIQSKFSLLEQVPAIPTSGNSLVDVAQKEVKHINQTIESITPEVLASVVKSLNQAETIFTFGQGGSALISQLFAYLLNQIAMNARSLVSTHLSVEQQIVNASSKDVLVVFSFPPYSKSTIENAKLASEKGIKVLAFTDSRTSPIYHHANQCLFIRGEKTAYSNSFAALSVTMNALVVELMAVNKEKSMRHLKNVHDLMITTKHYQD